jgi:hypothetical protein
LYYPFSFIVFYRKMGGSAFKLEAHGFTTSRMSKSQYDTLSQYILPLLKLYFHNVAVPPEAPDKTTFGDLDVMVCKPIDLVPHDAILQICSRALGDRCKMFIYGSTTNIAITLDEIIVQVDVHVVPSEEMWRVDYWMHSYGDMGMIISSMIKAWNLRLSSSRGLWVEVPGVGVFTLCRDAQRIGEFLGLDWERYNRGFDSVEDLFSWMERIRINGKAVGVKKRGKLEIRTHQKRMMWCAFWERGEDVAYDPSAEEKEQVFQTALDYFGKRQELKDIQKKLERDKLAREKLNANIVMELTGLHGKSLGLFMKALKGDERLMSNVADLPDETIKCIILKRWKGTV